VNLASALIVSVSRRFMFQKQLGNSVDIIHF